MIYWVPFLHFYQPPTQSLAMLKKVCNESYRPLLKMFLKHPQAKVTINICAVLTEMLNEYGASDVLEDIKKLKQNKQLEFVDSAKYHAILPLIPEGEMRRQIKQNHQTNAYFFKDLYKVRGFFPPEMCYSDEVASLLYEMGYEWILISGIACPDKWPLSEVYKASFDKLTLKIFYRDDILSNKISFHHIDSIGFISELLNLSKGHKDIYVITAMDAETFGHHIRNWERLFLGRLYEIIEGVAKDEEIKPRLRLTRHHRQILQALSTTKITVLLLSEVLDKFPVKKSRLPLPSSWSTTKEDIRQGNYYPLWKSLKNRLHRLQWEHVELCFELVSEAHNLKDNKVSERFYNTARVLLDRAIHSCQFWWANAGKTWDVNLVNKGLILQEEVILNAYKSIDTSGAEEEIKRELSRKVIVARNIANRIRDRLFADDDLAVRKD